MKYSASCSPFYMDIKNIKTVKRKKYSISGLNHSTFLLDWTPWKIPAIFIYKIEYDPIIFSMIYDTWDDMI